MTNVIGRNYSKSLLLYIIILILPLIVFHWMAPFISSNTLGNDYQVFSIQHQIELMFSLKTGSFPLYIPGYAGGQSSSALTLGQIFHPISWFSSLMPGYWEGKATEWNSLFRLFSLGITQLLLFEFLRRLKFNNLISFLLSFITVYNLQMLGLFDYGASLESWTGYLMACTAIGFYYLNPKSWTGSLFIIGSIYWLICSGHPQMMYYGIIGIGFFTLIIPYFIKIILPDSKIDLKHVFSFWIRTILFFLTGILLSSAYIFPFYFDFITTNAGRVGRSYAWADMYRDTFMGTINNFFQPFKTYVGGNFGGSSLFLLAALTPILTFFRKKVPYVIWIIWAFLLLVFLHMQGERTPIHYIIWKNLPLASNFRIAGRASMIIPPFLMMILAWQFRVDSCFPISIPFSGKKYKIYPPIILGGIAIFLFFLYFLLPDSVVSDAAIYSPINIRKIPEWIMALNILIGVLVITTFSILNLSIKNYRVILELFLCTITLIQVNLLLKHGTWIAPKIDTPSYKNMISEKKEKLDYLYIPCEGLTSNIVLKQIERAYLEPFLCKFYSEYIIAQNNEDAYSIMERGRTQDQIVLEGYSKKNSGIKNKAPMNLKNNVKLTYSSFNRLVFDVSILQPGFLGLSYPYTGHWKALINKQKVPVYKCNGAGNAVYLAPGNHQIEFRYWSDAAFWGMALSCFMIIIIGFISAQKSSNKNIRNFIKLISISLGMGILIIWYHSLYTGKNLCTNYSWVPDSPKPIKNIAYSKKTTMPPFTNNTNSWFFISFPFYHPSGNAVDGNLTPFSGFITELQSSPWWMVDLYHINQIGSIVLYESKMDGRMNLRPLIIAFSNNAKEWQEIYYSGYGNPIYLSFDIPFNARYVKIKASGVCRLSFNEIEIYPPE